jgi:hypothetical protein
MIKTPQDNRPGHQRLEYQEQSHSHRSRFSLRVGRTQAALLGAGLVLISLTGCGSAETATRSRGGAPERAQPAMEAPPAALSVPEPVAPSVLDQSSQNFSQDLAVLPDGSRAANVPAPKPQLIRNGSLTLTVRSVKNTMQAVNTILKAQQGELMRLQDNRPTDDSAPYTVEMELRIPQNRLDATMEALAKQGVIQSQGISAEDVSTQLVDMSARLRNLRRSEEMLLQLMQRSGSVNDILKVTQELSKIRESIEQLDAQYTSLKNQVAYSKITLVLQSELAVQTPQQNLSTQLEDAWNGSTRAFYNFSITLLKLLIFLLVFSPFWGSLLFLIIRSQKIRKARKLRKKLGSAPVTTPPLAEAVVSSPSQVDTPEN